MTQFFGMSSKILFVCVILSMVFCLSEMKMTIKNRSNLVVDGVNQDVTNSFCLSYLSFNIWENPVEESNKWYGLKGKSLTGNTFENGHAFELHVAVEGRCTLEQKQLKKTVFYNMYEIKSALKKIPAECNVPDHTTFTYNYHGKFSSPGDYILGIDCKTDEIKFFTDYFVQFKRAIQNPIPTVEEYLNSDYVTIWTFYPKRT